MMVVGDLEADGLLDRATRIWCGVFKDRETGEIHKFFPGSHVDYIHAMLQYLDTVDVLCMHNGVDYDWPLLKKLYNYEYKGEKVDTIIMSRLMLPKLTIPFNCPNKKTGPHSVESWGYRLGRGKPDHEDWSQFSDAMLHRCAEDVEIQCMIYDELLSIEGNWDEAVRRTTAVFEILHMQESYGWLMDQEQMDRSISMLNHWIDKIDRVVVPTLPLILNIKETKKKGEYNYVKKPFLKSGGYSRSVDDWYSATGLCRSGVAVCGPYSRIEWVLVDLNSNAQTKQYLLDAGWIPAEWNYKKDDRGKYVKDGKGNLIKTSPKLNGDDPFEGVEGRAGRLIAKRVQCRHRRSQIEGWVKRIRPDGRLSQVVTSLTTTRRMKHQGIVNVPGGDSFFGKWMRKCFTSKDGYVIVGTDSAGCQNRMLAARVGNDGFTETLINGKKEDGTAIHQVNQQAIQNIAGLAVTYSNSKNLNYAFMFGASDNKLGSIVNRGKDDGGLIRKALLSVAPGFAELVEGLIAEWRSTAKKRLNKWNKVEYYDGYITGIDGSPVLIESEHCLLVYLLQSDEAIMMQYALLFLYKWCCNKGWTHGVEYGFVANVHDEIQAEVREDIAEEFAALAEKAIVVAGEYLNISCPHAGEADIGENWWDTH
jgi:hypothetical protein